MWEMKAWQRNLEGRKMLLSGAGKVYKQPLKIKISETEKILNLQLQIGSMAY